MGIYSTPQLVVPAFTLDLGDGSDGSVVWSTSTVAKQIYQATNMTIPAGVTVTLSTSFLPSIWRVRGTLTIAGSIIGTGLGYAGGAGFGNESAGGSAGSGPRGGSRGASCHGHGDKTAYGGEGGGRDLGALESLLLGGATFYLAGSGGGGGGGSHWDRWGNAGPVSGGNGARGGNGLLVLASRIVFESTAVINLSGANGSPGGGDGNHTSGGGGAGAGGDLLAAARSIVMPSSGTIVTTLGGTGGAGTFNGTTGEDGEDGMVYLCYLESITTTDAASRCNPAATVLKLKSNMSLN